MKQKLRVSLVLVILLLAGGCNFPSRDVPTEIAPTAAAVRPPAETIPVPQVE